MGYSVFRHDRLTRGGGVAVFCRGDVSVENMVIPSTFRGYRGSLQSALTLRLKDLFIELLDIINHPGFHG